jgi:threonine/homoserine efflux transporter RhtA
VTCHAEFPEIRVSGRAAPRRRALAAALAVTVLWSSSWEPRLSHRAAGDHDGLDDHRAVVLLAAGAAAEGVPALSPEAIAMIAWLAAMNTAVAFTLWNFSLRRLTAGTSSVVNNAMLPQIGLLGWLVLGEAPGPWQWAGMILVSAGVAVAASERGAGPPAA